MSSKRKPDLGPNRTAIEASISALNRLGRLEEIDAAVLELGDETLKKIAHELVRAVRSSASIDWNLKESVRAEMRAKIKRLLARYDYPPDKEERAIDLVIQQAELFATEAA